MMNVRLFHYSKEIRTAVMIVHGDKAHSFYMGKDAYNDMVKNGKYTIAKHNFSKPKVLNIRVQDF